MLTWLVLDTLDGLLVDSMTGLSGARTRSAAAGQPNQGMP
jgi:hypothetical protein